MDSPTRALKFQGWGVAMGVPALFLLAYLYPRIPVLNTAETCAVKGFLGFPCPGCGLTTAFVRLTHGDLVGSIDAHPLGLVIAGWLLYQLVRAVCAAIAGRWPKAILTQRQRDWLLCAFLAALFLQWIVRLVLLFHPRL